MSTGWSLEKMLSFGALGAFVVTAGVVLTAGSGASAAGTTASEPLTVTVGRMEVVDLAFAVENFKVADPSVAKADVLGTRQVRVAGLKAGSTDLQVTGPGGASALFAVTVVENIQAVFAAVSRDLDALPELELSVNMGRVVVRGDVTSLDHWAYLERVANLYGTSVANLATLKPAAEILASLRKSLERGGFKVVTDAAATAIPPGSLKVTFADNNIFVAGKVFGKKELDRLTQIVQAQPGLQIASPEEVRDEDNPKVQAILDVVMLPTLLELDACFVSVTEDEERQIGVDLAKAGLITIDSTTVGLKGFVGEDRPEDGDAAAFVGSYTIQSGLQGALRFFAGSGPGRFHTAGHMTFNNDSPEWRMFHSGGTLKIKVSGVESSELEDIDYGLIMKVKGGLVDAATASLDISIELSYPVPLGQDYDLKKNLIESTVTCPVGNTLVMGGMNSLVEQTNLDGVPILRSIPVLQWLFSENKRSQQDSKILILLSPQLAPVTKPSKPVSEQTIPAEEEAQVPLTDREHKKRGWFFFF